MSNSVVDPPLPEVCSQPIVEKVQRLAILRGMSFAAASRPPSTGVVPRRTLVAGNLLLIALLVLHTLDHTLRQTATVPAEAATAATVGFVATVAALALSLGASRWAAAATAVVGLATAAGFVAVHVLPEWSVFSQPYADIEVDMLSWVTMFVPALAAAGVGTLGLSRLAHRP
ncbi:hypothetical protein BH20ACT19_BH20ACT19_13040 [soil metagenome]